MIIQRIAALINPSPDRRSEVRSALPAPGQSVQLVLDDLLGGDVFATTPGGHSLRLTGLDALSRNPQPGDIMSMRVLANDPVLELQLYNPRAEASPAPPPLTLSDYPAMRLDLAELRTIAWAAPSAAALAMAWQIQASERTEFPVYVWSGARRGGLRMTLRLIDPDEEQSQAQAQAQGVPRRARRSRSVRIELSHPSLGHMVVDLHWRLGGIQLTLGVESAAAKALRAVLPAILAALGKANLRLTRVRLTPGHALARAPTNSTPRSIFDAREPLDPRLFRAAAEIAVALLNPGSPRC
jgi:hypothetical protein